MKNRNLHYYIQTLSPVHVGSGEKLRAGLDFLSVNNHTWMVDRRKLEQALSQDPQALEEFTTDERFDVHSLIAKFDLVSRDYDVGVTATEMFEFVRTGMGVPYLPGSSMKGALRTVLLWKLCQDENWQSDHDRLLKTVLSARRDREADNAIVEKAFNVAVKKGRAQDSNRDLMRVLQVSDSHFAAADLQLADARILNLMSGSSCGWKNMSTRRNERRPQDATQLAAEALRIGAVAPVTLTIAEFLLQSDAAKDEARFKRHAELFHDLAAHSNQYAARQIAKQRTFFEPFSEMQPIVQFYDELEEIRRRLKTGDFMLRLSWGSGWHGMTGEWVEDPDELLEVRKAFNMGKFVKKGSMPDQCPHCGSPEIAADKKADEQGFCHSCKKPFPIEGLKREPFPVFPKTRKIMVRGNHAAYPFGWVLFTRNKPNVREPEERPRLAPPPYRPQGASAGVGRVDPLAELLKRPKKQPKPKIKVGDRIRAEVIAVTGSLFDVRLLQLDEGRALSFVKHYIFLQPGDLLHVRVKSTNAEGTVVRKIEFLKKI